jgi:cyanophycinase
MPFALARESLPDSLPSMAVKSATGPAIVIGGALRDDNSAVWSRLIDLAGGPGAHFVVLATASGDPDAAARGTIAALTAHGAVAEHLRVAPELKGVDLRRAVRDPALIDKVRAANGVFFTGGDQARIVVTLLKGPLRPDQDFGAGLDFAQSDLFVDQHFLRRGRLGRMCR